MIQRIVIQVLLGGLVGSLVACSTVPSATDDRTSQQVDGVTSTPRSSPKRTCEQARGERGLSACTGCCLEQSPKAEPYAIALGHCNLACGKSGSTSCFARCEQSYVDSCNAASGACKTYDVCTKACFGG